MTKSIAIKSRKTTKRATPTKQTKRATKTPDVVSAPQLAVELKQQPKTLRARIRREPMKSFVADKIANPDRKKGDPVTFHAKYKQAIIDWVNEHSGHVPA